MESDGSYTPASAWFPCMRACVCGSVGRKVWEMWELPALLRLVPACRRLLQLQGGGARLQPESGKKGQNGMGGTRSEGV